MQIKHWLVLCAFVRKQQQGSAVVGEDGALPNQVDDDGSQSSKQVCENLGAAVGGGHPFVRWCATSKEKPRARTTQEAYGKTDA